jgi:hypothetical protein
VFVERPISAVFIALCTILIVGQLYFRLFSKAKKPEEAVEQPLAAE